MHELGRGDEGGTAEGRPALAVEREGRPHRHQVQVGLPERVQGAHVAPVAGVLDRAQGLDPLVAPGDHHVVLDLVHGGEVEGVDRLAGGHHGRDHVLAEIQQVVVEPVVQGPVLEHVDAHGGHAVGGPRDAPGLLGLLLEADDPAVVVHLQHAELAGGHGGRHPDHRDGEAGLAGLVVFPQPAVVHLVDVVPGQQQDGLGLGDVDEGEVLPDGVGGALVPVVAHLHLGRHLLDELVQPRGEEIEAEAEVPAERVRLVLGQHQDLADLRIDAVAEGEIDDPVDGAEGHRGLGPQVRERAQALPHSAGHDYR